MGFKTQDNTGKKLVLGDRHVHGNTLWDDLLTRKADAPLLSQRDRWPAANAYTNEQLQAITALVNGYIYERMVWRSDSQTRGQLDIYFSRAAQLLFGSQREYGDCDDFMVTAQEFYLLWRIRPEFLLAIQVLTKPGQKSNYYGKTRMDANHWVGGVWLADGDVQIIDSNQGRSDSTLIRTKPYPTRLLLSETDYQVHIVHQLSDFPIHWYYGNMVYR